MEEANLPKYVPSAVQVHFKFTKALYQIANLLKFIDKSKRQKIQCIKSIFKKCDLASKNLDFYLKIKLTCQNVTIIIIHNPNTIGYEYLNLNSGIIRFIPYQPTIS